MFIEPNPLHLRLDLPRLPALNRPPLSRLLKLYGVVRSPAHGMLNFPSRNRRVRVSLCFRRCSSVIFLPVLAAEIFRFVSSLCGCAIQTLLFCMCRSFLNR